MRSLLRLADAPLAVGVEEQDPLVAAHREPVARDGLAIADTLEEGVAADDVLVLACGAGWKGGWRALG